MSVTATTIVITGATGKTGRRLVERLAARPNVKVRCAVRSPERARSIFKDGLKDVLKDVELVAFDYDRPETVGAALRGAQRLYLVTPGGNAQLAQTRIASDAAKEAGLERIVKLGSFDPGRGPSILVEQWCAQSEQMVKDSGCAWTFLRPTWFNQNFTEYIMRPLMGRVFAPLGTGRSAWVDCRDIADVADVALAAPMNSEHDGKTYTLTGPAVYSMDELVAMLSRECGRTIRYVNVPPLMQKVMGRLMGFPALDVTAILQLLGKMRDGWHTDITDDVERVTHRKPIAFEQFAKDAAAELGR